MAYTTPLADGFSNDLAMQNTRRYAQPVAYTAPTETSSAPSSPGSNQATNIAAASNAPWYSPQVTNTAPAPIQSFGPTPSVSPTYADPAQNLGYMNYYSALVGTELAPQFQAQDQQLQDQLASRGVTGGAAQYLTNQLTQGQGATYAGAVAPIVQQGYGYTQQDIQGNQAAANAAAGTNAQYYADALGADYGAYNNYLSTLLNMGGQNYGALQGAYLNSFGPNSGVTSAYNTATGGIGSTFGNVFNNQTNAQNQALGQGFQAAALAFGG